MEYTVYRVITEKGYVEFLAQEDAENFAQGREIQEYTVEKTEPEQKQPVKTLEERVSYLESIIGGIA